MKIGFIVLCRLSSTRLPGKILMDIDGIPVLQHILDRLQKVKPLEEIVVATSDESSDDLIEKFCVKNNVNCYRGDLKNVAKRFLEAAEKFEFDYATRINGDNIFIDIEAMQSMLEVVKNNKYDFVSNVKNRTFPFGMSIEIVKTSFYKKLIKQLTDQAYREHVTLYLYHQPDFGNQFHFENQTCPEAKGMRFAIDESKDFEQAKKIMSVLKIRDYDYNLKELVQLSKEI